jgi:muconolactone D-isomerase
MLFYVQMRWNYEGRLTMDQLWDLETKETEAAAETLKSGMCKCLYRSPDRSA